MILIYQPLARCFIRSVNESDDEALIQLVEQNGYLPYQMMMM